MRADRLIALLLLLQRRGRVTAAEAAEELEVSLRTARRDLDALAMSGVPIYPRRGRGGGWELIGGASTDLSGLSADEARALFMAVGPALTDSPDLRMALRKLSAALPDGFQQQAEAAATSVKVDPSGWGRVGTPSQPRFLDQLGRAVTAGRRIELDYESPSSGRRRRTVHPLGLVTKRNVWYLVGSTDAGIRTYRVGRIRDVEVLDLPVERPADFDLDAAWQDIVTGFEAATTTVVVRARTTVGKLGPLRWVFGNHFSIVSPRPAPDAPDEGPEREIELEIGANSIEAFAAQAAGFGRALTLVDPPAEVVEHLARIGAELAARYGPGRTNDHAGDHSDGNDDPTHPT